MSGFAFMVAWEDKALVLAMCSNPFLTGLRLKNKKKKPKRKNIKVALKRVSAVPFREDAICDDQELLLLL